MDCIAAYTSTLLEELDKDSTHLRLGIGGGIAAIGIVIADVALHALIPLANSLFSSENSLAQLVGVVVVLSAIAVGIVSLAFTVYGVAFAIFGESLLG